MPEPKNYTVLRDGTEWRDGPRIEKHDAGAVVAIADPDVIRTLLSTGAIKEEEPAQALPTEVSMAERPAPSVAVTGDDIVAKPRKSRRHK